MELVDLKNKIVMKKFSRCKKNCLPAKALHECIGVKTVHRSWIARYVLDVRNYQKGYDYLFTKGVSLSFVYVTIHVAIQMCRRAATLRSVEAAEFLEELVGIDKVEIKKAYAHILREYKALYSACKSIGLSDRMAKQESIGKILDFDGVDIKKLFPELLETVNGFTIKEMAKILDLTAMQVITILGDMAVLGAAFKQPPFIIKRTELYALNMDKTDNVVNLIFCPETLVMIDVKKQLEAALFWDYEAKSPRDLPAGWLNSCASMKYLEKIGITLDYG